jgi:hypothetical protein
MQYVERETQIALIQWLSSFNAWSQPSMITADMHELLLLFEGNIMRIEQRCFLDTPVQTMLDLLTSAPSQFTTKFLTVEQLT